MEILDFLVWTGVCYWVIVLDGATTIEGWKSFFLFGPWEATLTPQELKFYFGISWIVSLVMLVVALASG